VVLSVEKDAAAHQTLLLRAFFRHLESPQQLKSYYKYLRGTLSLDALFSEFPQPRELAESRCLHLELGPRTTQGIYADIDRLLRGQRHWVLVGGPPCQAYSVVGRSRLSKLKREEFEKNEKHVLYREYLRILARYSPPVFVMENVKGLLSATYGGASTFERIIGDLSSPSVAVRESLKNGNLRKRRGGDYNILSLVKSKEGELKPQDYIIAAEDFGIPQRRHRVILLGIRSDLKIPENLGLKRSTGPAVQDVLDDLPALRSQLSREKDAPCAWVDAIREAFCSFQPEDIDGSTLEIMRKALSCLEHRIDAGGKYVPKSVTTSLPQSRLTDWLVDSAMDFVVNHETRKHIREDLLRYLFVASYAVTNGLSPKLHQFPAELLPNHRNVPTTVKNRHGFFNDRFRVQVAGQPATTVTSHMSKDGHYFIHHDPTQCRSWTVREAARVQTFPDNYYFAGTRTEQFQQVGNAVPPYLALQIAEVVASIFAAQG
jgi:DNA (cytosine-5)-methyltransferase 1